MFLKMYKSLENKLHDENLIWWNSLSMKARYSLLFCFLTYKKGKDVKIKHFIKSYRKIYTPTQTRYREAIIDHIMK